MQFLFPALVAGFLFVIVPPLVHLINMLRHRKQSWAAMEFLLASYRKQRRWIILRQLLLLLARIAIAALLIAMLTGWSGASGWLDSLGGQVTHHVVILDDSFSMSDSSGGATAYERAKTAIDGMTRRLADAEGTHQLTVLRTSRAGLIVRGGSEAGDAAADISAAELGPDRRLIERLMATKPSSLDDDCVAAVRLAADLITATDATETVMYLMSDFRLSDWEAAERAKEAIGSTVRQGTEVRMIDCAVAPKPNLAVTVLEPKPDVWVAGVPVLFRVSVANYGKAPARNVNVAARLVQYGGSSAAFDPTMRFSGQVESLPGLVFEEIAVGEEVTKEFQVYVPDAGTHAVEVELPDDAVLMDNRRVTTLPLKDASRVLIVDGDINGKGAYHVASVLDPGSQVRTGALPDVQPASYLRTVRPSDLNAYRAVYLINVPEVDSTAADALRAYVESGGGLMWFIGKDVVKSRYNEVLTTSRRFLLPGKLQDSVPLARSGATGTPDMVLADAHPLSAPLAAVGDAALALVSIGESFEIDLDSQTSVPVNRVFDRRDGEPLVLQHDVGQGRVVTVLMGLDGITNNWPSDPTFVVFLLKANAYLWSAAQESTSQRIDQAVEFSLRDDEYAPSLTYLAAVSETPRIPMEELLDATDTGMLEKSFDPLVTAIEGGDDLDAMLQPGLAEFWLTRLDGSPEVSPVALTVNAREGKLARLEHSEIRRTLQPASVSFYDAEEMVAAGETNAGGLMPLVLLGLLAIILMIEQFLGYLASYHSPVQGANA